MLHDELLLSRSSLEGLILISYFWNGVWLCTLPSHSVLVALNCKLLFIALILQHFLKLFWGAHPLLLVLRTFSCHPPACFSTATLYSLELANTSDLWFTKQIHIFCEKSSMNVRKYSTLPFDLIGACCICLNECNLTIICSYENSGETLCLFQMMKYLQTSILHSTSVGNFISCNS